MLLALLRPYVYRFSRVIWWKVVEGMKCMNAFFAGQRVSTWKTKGWNPEMEVEDDFPFQFGDVQFRAVSSQGCTKKNLRSLLLVALRLQADIPAGLPWERGT